TSKMIWTLDKHRLRWTPTTQTTCPLTRLLHRSRRLSLKPRQNRVQGQCRNRKISALVNCLQRVRHPHGQITCVLCSTCYAATTNVNGAEVKASNCSASALALTQKTPCSLVEQGVFAFKYETHPPNLRIEDC